MPAFRLALLALFILAAAPGFAANPVPPAAPPAHMPPPPPPPTTDVSGAPAGLYIMDKNHAGLMFRISHMGFSLYQGRFDSFEGKINVDPKAPEKSTVDVTVDINSVDTHNPKLEGELKEWFKTAQFPTATFHSTSLVKTGPATGELTGDLTMMGQTHPVKLSLTFHGYGLQFMTNKPTMGFSASGMIKRSQWGLANYVPLVGDDVLLQIDAEFNKAETTPAVAPPPPPAAPAPRPAK